MVLPLGTSMPVLNTLCINHKSQSGSIQSHALPQTLERQGERNEGGRRQNGVEHQEGRRHVRDRQGHVLDAIRLQ